MKNRVTNSILGMICRYWSVCRIAQYALFLLSFSLFNQAICQPDWVLVRNRDGVHVYTKFYKDKGLKQLKAETIVSGVTLHAFVAIFRDIENVNKWTSTLKYSKCLKIINENEYVNYFLTDIPWPLKKREGIFRVNVWQDKADKTLNIESNAFPEFLPETDTVVRILEAKAVWKFTPIGNNQLKVQSIFYADPRGFPPFLVNLFVTDAPLETMTKLREFVKQDKYKNAKFDFIQD
jgi:START domain